MKLEDTFDTNTCAIQTLSVNESVCIIGSEDCLFCVWELDFSELRLQGKNEAAVCSVDISPDGLNIVSGTTSGGIVLTELDTQRS